MPYFKQLLNKVLYGAPSAAEYDEFVGLYQTGEYDHQFTEEDIRNSVLRSKSSDDALVKEVAAGAYNEVCSRMKRMTTFSRSRMWMAAAATICFAVAMSLWFIAKERNWFDPSGAQPATKLARYVGKQVVDLPDGTKIVLNRNSELSYARPFGKLNREVTLIGEAAFDVAHDASKPFVIHTGKITTKVLGTEFNIHAYPGEANITVTVLRGLVEVGDRERVYGQIKPNEQIEVNVFANTFTKGETNAGEAMKWRANFIILDDVAFEKAAAIIGERFNITIRFENPELKKCRVIGTFMNDESLDTVLSLLSRIMDVTYTVEKDGSVVLKGDGCGDR